LVNIPGGATQLNIVRDSTVPGVDVEPNQHSQFKVPITGIIRSKLRTSTLTTVLAKSDPDFGFNVRAVGSSRRLKYTDFVTLAVASPPHDEDEEAGLH
jgi:hypothetical protein